jgi:hypothetical protein
MVAVRAGALACIFTFALALGGCIVETEHSIIETPASPDKRLVGVWALEADGGAQVLVLYQKEEEPDRLHATFVIVNDGEVPPASRAAVKFSQIGGRAYFEARWRPGDWLPLDPPVRQAIGTYEISGSAGAETLKLCFADPESFAAPLKSGALKGFSGKGDNYERRVVISSEAEELRAYLAKNHFKCATSATYRRVTGPAQSK